LTKKIDDLAKVQRELIYVDRSKNRRLSVARMAQRKYNENVQELLTTLSVLGLPTLAILGANAYGKHR
jgi:hypothetical protein